jgi:hypothetical protein
MTFRHGKTTLVLVRHHDVSRFLNDSTVSDEIEANETTTYGQGAKLYMAGLEDVTLSVSGLYDGGDDGVDGVDQILEQALHGDELVPVLVVSDSPGLHGRRCAFFDSVTTTFETSNPVGDVVTISGEFQGSNGTANGLILSSRDAVTNQADDVIGDETFESVDAGDYPTSRFRGVVHVLANDRGGTMTFQFQQSADDVTFAAVGDPITVPAGEVGVFKVELDTEVERYLRLDVTAAGTTGSATIVAAGARL